MTAQQELDGFIDKFTPDVAAMARKAVKKMRARFPHAHVLVYDNYNALAIGLGPSETTGEAIFSIAVFPKHPSLFFLQNGPSLPDPKKRLEGSGNVARHIKLKSADDLDDPVVIALMDEALLRAKVPLDGGTRGRLVIKSISARQRPRRPSPTKSPRKTTRKS